MQKCRILRNDGWDDVLTPTLSFDIDKQKPRVEVTIEEWDEKLLLENYEEMKLLDGDSFNFDPTGVSEKEINSIRDSLLPPRAKDDGFKEEDVDTNIKEGDVIALGRHRIVCGDSTNPEHVEKLYLQEIAASSFTSPPYNAGKEGWLGSSESKYEGDG